MKLAALISGGKDSLFSLYFYHLLGHEIKVLIAIKSKNPYSYMFHTPAVDFVEIHSKLLNIPLITQYSVGKKEEELQDLFNALKKARQEYDVCGVIVGAIDSDYQRHRVNIIAESLGLRAFSPLWRKNYENYLHELFDAGFEFTLTKIMAYGIKKEWLGKSIHKGNYMRLLNELKENKVNLVFEGGESETLVLDMPLFKKRIILDDVKRTTLDEYEYVLEINHFILQNKK